MELSLAGGEGSFLGRMGTGRTSRIRTRMNFLQRFFHIGCYGGGGVGGEGCKIFLRDYNQPSPDDCFDKTLMPEVMQVKNFGKSGRSKWTHLVAEDTVH